MPEIPGQGGVGLLPAAGWGSWRYEAIFHASDMPACMLHLRGPARTAVLDELEPERLERAIGVVYRPETELQSHYFYPRPPREFDETSAVHPLAPPKRETAVCQIRTRSECEGHRGRPTEFTSSSK